MSATPASESPSKYLGHKSIHNFERFFTGFIAEGALITCESEEGVVARVPLLADEAVCGCWFVPLSVWLSVDGCFSSSCDFELSEAFVTADDGRSGVPIDSPIVV